MEDSGIFGWIITYFTILGILFLAYVIVMIIVMMAPKTPNRGTLLAFFGGPLAYIYVGKWGKAIGLYLLVLITGGFTMLFIWPYSMVNIRTDVRKYLEDNVVRQTSIQKLGLEVQKLERETANSLIDKAERLTASPPKPVPSPVVPAASTTSLHSLSIQVSGEGNTVPAEGTYQFKKGTAVFVNAIASDGWQFAGWIGKVEDAYSPGTSIEIDSDKTVTATFQSLE
ncbi:hypothetical protein ACFLU8_04975 [Chloroflexota bacterium]